MLSAVLAAALAAAPLAGSPGEFEHLRPASPHVRELVDELRAHSGTFAALLDRLSRTNVAVYVQLVTQLPTTYFGRLHFVSASGGFRFVRIQVRAGVPFVDLAASLAHELRHAIEIGEHEEVRCEETLEALYQRIGHSRSRRGYETMAAIEAGRRVRAELLSARSRPADCEEGDQAERCAP